MRNLAKDLHLLLDGTDGDFFIQSLSASFIPGPGVLSVFGDNLDNSIVASRNAAGNILINGGAVSVLGGTPTVANTSLIQVFGLGGNDTIRLDETNGALPRAFLFGGAGNDVLTGGSGADQLFGQSGSDTLLGRGGTDLLFGGAGNDVLTGGDGDDQMFGEAGNDRMIWNPGDDSDLMEGGSGTDTAEVNGGNGAESFTVTANGARVRFDRVDPAPFSIDIGTTENLVVNMNGGDDSFSATGNLAALIKITVDGGAGNDTILGGNGIDLLLGGDGNDFIDGNQGNDTALLGAGDDIFQWDPGDGSDVVEGQDGTDTMLFNGSGVGEIFEASANGERVRFTRNVGNIVMDLNDVEHIELNALGGADTVVITDLSSTDVSDVNIDLATAIGGNAGDGQVDTVQVNGTNGDDFVEVLGNATSAIVSGLSAFVTIANLEATDQLLINGLAGDDTINASTVPAGIMKLTIDGGAGDDTILGSRGADVLLGGDGNDFVDGNQGDDLALLGAGDDIFQWDPGDGSDVVEGQTGTDTMLFNGSNANENIDISANGERVRFFRDVANIVMDLNDVEHIQFNALGGADNIVIGDLSGTDVTQVAIDLAGAGGVGDGQADRVTVNGTAGIDTIGVVVDGDTLVVNGLPAEVRIDHAEAGNDVLVIAAGGGADVIDASGVPAGELALELLGGLGADVLIGSAGGDFFNGGDGDDQAIMGAGDDTFVWNPGDDNDTLEGQDGFDTMLFNGANVAENIDISANGERVSFFRNVANVTMDLNDVERIEFNALGGADTIVVNDLSGTDVSEVNIDLAGSLGGSAGDAQLDTVVINGTNGDDVISLSLRNGALVVSGLAAEMVIEHFDLTDIIRIVGLAGDDIIDASALGVGGPRLTLEGGDGDDILIGGAGDDTVLGNAGDDVLLGGAGNDVLDGGVGDNIVIQDTPTVGPDATLSLFADDNANTITIGRNAAGQIIANVPVPGTPTVANTGLIRVFGEGGNDTISLDEANGALPAAALFGGAGNDVLTGGSGADQLFGQSGNDTLLGRGGTDLLFGGAGNDVLTGGDGDDQMFGEGGNDRMIWNPGDDTDLVEGGTGIDTAEVNGGNGAETFTVTANGARVRFDRVEPAPFALDIGTTENLVVNMNGGDDSFSATGNLAALIKITVDGGAGNDTILGSNGIDLLLGGDGNDFIDGQQGNDVALLGAGEDNFQWDPGDGSDVVEGQDGTDTMLFNGSGVGEIFEASANGERVRFTRNVGNIVMDLNDVEHIELNALGGADTVAINDLSGTDVTQVDIDLAGTLGGSAGDGQSDTVIASGTNGADAVEVLANGTSAAVVGLPALVNIANAEGAQDQLVINGLGGDDTINASTLVAGIVKLTIDGGAGDDTILGSRGADVLVGGDGDDFVDGQQGDDIALLGAGDDLFQWDPGDGSDVVEGQDGFDRMLFNGSNASENIDVSANGARVRFFRDVANITMDLNDVESIAFKALGGADNIVVGDMSGTDLEELGIDLAGAIDGNAGDGQVDRITVSGTNGDDAISVLSLDESVAITGLQADVSIDHAEGHDQLVVNGLGGNDVLDASALSAGQMALTLNGGLGVDVLIGSAGGDFFNGGDGDDQAIMGAGDDTFVWNPGDDNDTLEGQDGFDTMLFNGANVAENIDISANGERVSFFRNVANVTMDLNDVERIEFNALGGADTIVVNDLSGTDVSEVNIDLAGSLGGSAGDAQPDTVILKATNGDDVAVVVGFGTTVSVLGLSAEVNIDHPEAVNDRLVIQMGAGDDVIEASGLFAGMLGLTLEGGAGDDVLIGSDGDDILDGGDGDDVLIGGGGNDVLIGGAGDNIVIQGFQAGADKIDLRSIAGDVDFDWVMAHAQEVDGDMIFDFGSGGQMKVTDVNEASLHADDFLL